MSLLADLARLLRRLDPMPARVLDDALAAGALVHRPLPELLVLADTVSAARSAGRRLRIGRAGEPLVEVEIRQIGDAQRLAGLVTAAPLTVRHENGDVEVVVGAGGYFTVEVPAGPLRIALDGAETDWL
jgi:hypothetical protein